MSGHEIEEIESDIWIILTSVGSAFAVGCLFYGLLNG